MRRKEALFSMQALCNNTLKQARIQGPERVIQFGEGNFLRGFVDWMLDRAHEDQIYDGSVVVVQPIETGLVDVLNAQDGLYHLVLRGYEAGEMRTEERLIQCVSRGLKAYEEWEQVLECAADPNIDVMISNTTEAGIVYSAADSLTDQPPKSFPAKVCAYLYHRYKTFGGDPALGMAIIPCELIEANGSTLRSIVLRLAEEWDLEAGFMEWLQEANDFVSTLVDRIVTGFPGDEEAADMCERFGFEDRLLDTGEIFHLWVLEGTERAARRFPMHKLGLNVHWVEDMTPYRTQKVRILNGAHTSTVALAHLAGHKTVRQTVEGDIGGRYLRRVLFDEIIPSMDADPVQMEQYAEQVLQRFLNPYIRHRWLDISLNSIAKYKARVLPSLRAHLHRGQVPQLLAFSMACLLRFYKGEELTEAGLTGTCADETYLIRDDRRVLEFFAAAHKQDWDDRTLVKKALGREEFWGEDLNQYTGLCQLVTRYVGDISKQGAKATAVKILEAGDKEDVYSHKRTG